MGNVLGSTMKVLTMSVSGDVPEDIGVKFVQQLVKSLGMSAAPGSTLCRYPVDNKGGVGYTIFQPITESFIAFDVWPELNGGYLVICSCGSLPIDPVLDTVGDFRFIGHQFFLNKLEL